MRSTVKPVLRWLSLVVVVVCLPPSVSAQTIWTPPTTGNSVILEILRPNFDDDDYLKFPTASVMVTLRQLISENSRLIVELPLAYSQYKDYGATDSELALGNPYIGFESGPSESAFFAEVGIRLPLAGEENWFAKWIGMLSDYTQRMGAYTANSIWLKGLLNYSPMNDTGFGARIRGGFSLWIPTEKGSGVDPELFMLYSAQISQSFKQISLWGGLAGRLFMSDEGFDLQESMISELGLGANLKLGNVHPGISLRLPLDENLSDMVKSIVGFQLIFLIE